MRHQVEFLVNNTNAQVLVPYAGWLFDFFVIQIDVPCIFVINPA